MPTENRHDSIKGSLKEYSIEYGADCKWNYGLGFSPFAPGKTFSAKPFLCEPTVNSNLLNSRGESPKINAPL
jgi:hypothetical protein